MFFPQRIVSQHGVQGDWHTMFPSPYSVAASFDRELMKHVGAVIGAEARAGAAVPLS